MRRAAAALLAAALVTPPAPAAAGAGGVFEATLGMPPADVAALADLYGPAGCETPADGTRGQILYVTNAGAACTWHAAESVTIGTAADPVILVFEGDFGLSGPVTVNGLVYVMGRMHGTAGEAVVNGALLADGGVTAGSAVRDDPVVLRNLSRVAPLSPILHR
jgi:hypothetical protein